MVGATESSFSGYLKAVKSLGISPVHQMAQLRHYIDEYRSGGFTVGGVNDVVREVGGSEPEDFETIVRRYVDSSPMAKPSLANKLRAIGGLIKILLTPAPNLHAYEKTQSQPLLRSPEYALDSAAWRETHDVTGAFGTTSALNESHVLIPSRGTDLVEITAGAARRSA